MNKFLIAAMALALGGCASVAPTVTTSGFDHAMIVEADDRGAICTSPRCASFGIHWTSRIPERAILTIYPGSDARAITGASISVGGRVLQLAPAFEAVDDAAPTTAPREQRKNFAVPVALLREIDASTDASLRLSTASGPVDEAITGPGTGSKARTVRRVLAEIDRRT